MDLYFWVFASMSVLAGLFTIVARDALPSAMGLLTVFIALASLYLHLHAPLIAIFQVAIYAGAILILVVFVIMLLWYLVNGCRPYRPMSHTGAPVRYSGCV